METLIRFRRAFAGGSCLATMPVAAVACLFGLPAAVGVLLGSGAGTLAFWATARSAGIAVASPNALKSSLRIWGLLRFLLYALAFAAAYRLDRVKCSGLIGAVGGLLIPFVVMLILGITGWDLKKSAE